MFDQKCTYISQAQRTTDLNVDYVVILQGQPCNAK